MSNTPVRPDTLRAMAQALSDACEQAGPLDATGAALALAVDHAAAHGIGPADLFLLFGRTLEIRLDGVVLVEDGVPARWPAPVRETMQ
jgi:hypothetical protein